MSGISVTPETLETAAANMAKVADALGGLTKAPSLDATALGGGEIAPAIEEFFDKWGYAISQIRSATEQLTANVNRAAEFYQRTDQNVANGANQIKANGTSAGLQHVPAGGGMRG